MSFLRTVRSALALVSIVALAGAAAGSGCAQPNGVSSTGTTGAGGGGASRCTGAPPACSGLDDFDCQTTNGCGHIGSCQGTAIDCSLLTAAGCLEQGGCSPMGFGNCFGSAQSCFNFNNQGACSQQVGCFWDQNKFFCTGAATNCQQLPNQSCATQLGCMLGQGSECEGTPTACSTFPAKDGCEGEFGCVWVSQCTGSPTACEALADADCPYQPGCTCDGCETTSSSSSSGGGPCTGQSDCDPANDPCRTGDCINGACIKIPNCLPCVKQVQCNPHKNPCLTGNCIDGMCQPVADCQACVTQVDCSAGTNKCFSGNCVDGKCEIKTLCSSGDGCCPADCAGKDSDCP